MRITVGTLLTIYSVALIITVAVRTCPASSTPSSRPTLLPSYSSLPYGASSMPTILSSMQPPPATSAASSIATTVQLSTSARQSAPVSQTEAPIPIPSYASGTNLTTSEGNEYLYLDDTALSGITIDGPASRVRRRQDPDQYRPLFDCLDDCDATPACVAITLLGQSCLLYGAVESRTYLLGAQSAFNQKRFVGFEDLTPETSTSIPFSSSSMGDSGAQSTPAPYSTPYMSTPGPLSSIVSSASPAKSSASSDTASMMSSSLEFSQSQAYSTPLLSTEHATAFTSPPSATSILSTILPVTLSIPSSTQMSQSEAYSTPLLSTEHATENTPPPR